jgi:Flp pilus assembly protein TadD
MECGFLSSSERGRALVLVTAFFFFLSFSFPAVFAAQEETQRAAALFREATTMFDDGQIDRAVETMKRAIAADPGNAESYDRLGYMLLRKDQPDDALLAFNAALKLKPTLRTAKNGVGLGLLKKGDLKGAEEELMTALSLNPYPSMTHYALGLVYEKMNDYEKAITQFKEGIKTFKDGKK